MPRSSRYHHGFADSAGCVVRTGAITFAPIIDESQDRAAIWFKSDCYLTCFSCPTIDFEKCLLVIEQETRCRFATRTSQVHHKQFVSNALHSNNRTGIRTEADRDTGPAAGHRGKPSYRLVVAVNNNKLFGLNHAWT